MALSMDPQVGAALARVVAGLGEPKPRPAVGDWRTRRENGNAMFGVCFAPDADVSRRAIADRVRALRTF